jgi:hypothetical protein
MSDGYLVLVKRSVLGCRVRTDESTTPDLVTFTAQAAAAEVNTSAQHDTLEA